MRSRLVAGNWKMNLAPAAAQKLAREVRDILRGVDAPAEVLICPPFVSLAAAREMIAGSPIRLGAQNCAAWADGAYTGEVSASMLAEAGCSHVLVAHSERRQFLRERDEDFIAKIDRAHAAGLVAVFCFGEVIGERRAGRAEAVVRAQLEGVLPHLKSATPVDTVLAYEPVWAIGTGETATPETAQAMHAFARGVVAQLLGQPTAEAMRILYGGSVKAANAASLFAQPDLDGGLVGGASLQAAEFAGIVRGAAAGR
jgi:triosephosphate isomerase (TIM)